MPGNAHLTRPVTEWGAAPADARLAVLAVHGRAQTPEFMREVSADLAAPGVRFFAPHAAGDSWYPCPFTAPLQDNEPDLTYALETLRARLAGLEAQGFDRRSVVLWGFSQGACLLSHFAVHEPAPIGGLILFTGGYLGTVGAPPRPGRPLAGVPALLRSIADDPWVAADRVRRTAAALTVLGATVDVRIDPGDEHVITPEARASAATLLAGLPGRAVA